MRIQRVYLGLMNFLLLMVFISALFLVDVTNSARKVNQSLGQLHKAYDDELENYSRLRLEQGPLTSRSRIERNSVDELNKTIPYKIYGLVE